MEKNIKIRLRSERFEINTQTIDLFAGGINPTVNAENADSGDGGKESGKPEEVELFTEGRLKTEGGRTELSYDESELSGLEGSRTYLVFDNALPDTLTMMRSGTMKVTMVFCPGLRQLCRYDNPLIPFDIVLMTRTLDNRLLSDGELELDYITELAGSSRARTKLRIIIQDVED